MPPGDSDFVDDIVADRLPTHTSPRSNDFKPWHRVRKEFIRQFQWNLLTSQLIKRRWKQELKQVDDLSESDLDSREEVLGLPYELPKRPLRCLVIPGDDLLDIRSLWRDTSGLDCVIRYLGFNESHGSNHEGTRVHIANNAVTSLDRVAKDSQVIPDRFERITSPQSQARRYLRSYGPYHVVNLDFCGSIFPNTQNDSGPYHEAIHQLLKYQFAEQKAHWLLFITTEVQPSIADTETFQRFADLTRENYDSYAEFREGIDVLLPPHVFQSTVSSIEITNLSDEQITKLFGVSLGKWLLKLSHSAQPQWTIEMRRSYQYTINEEKGAVMLALAFEFMPNITPPVDSSGISKLDVVPKVFASEKDCAVKIAKGVAGIQDVDARLEADAVLKAKIAEDHADLLAASGFDRVAYLKWVADGEVI